MRHRSYKFLVRLPAAMRAQLTESARYYRRSINSDIVARLQLSFSGLPGVEEQQALAPMLECAGYDARALHQLFRRELSDEEEQLVLRFRALPENKRLALLDLLS